MSDKKVNYGIVGSGWRAEFFLRAARELPEKFSVCGLVTRREETGRAIEKKFGVKTFRTIGDLLKNTAPDFAVASVAGSALPGVIRELAQNGVPVLSETPPAYDMETLAELNGLAERGAKIQVAEQYHLQPLHAARIKLAASGKLGEITHAQVSFSHGYHAMSLARKLLGIGYENAAVRGVRFAETVVEGPGRYGLPEEEKLAQVGHVVATLDFGGKTALYDFADNQHRSLVRSQRIVVRGSRGEIDNLSLKYLKDFRTPVETELLLKNTGLWGNVDDYYIKGVLAGEEWVYENPYIPAKFSEDEVAVATCLDKMGDFVSGGPELYSLAEASQDCYLGLMLEKAVQSGETVVTETQPWAR